MSSVELRRVGRRFADGTTAVADLDLLIDDGEFFVLLGPSGCGKTSVLRMIAGLDATTSGDVLIDGVRVNDLTPQQRDVAMAFQQHALYPHMSAGENIGFALKVGGAHAREVSARVREIAELLVIGDVLDRRPSELSGGQQQRVALGRAIVRNPRLFLMDEPMSNLDTKLRVEARTELVKIHRRLGTTIVFVTHDQSEAMAIADRIAVMRAGTIVQCGPPLDVYREPVDVFVAQFVGSPPMAIVEATVVEGTAGCAVRIGPATVPLAQRPDRAPAGTGDERALVGRRIAVGLRPEALVVDDAGPIVASVDRCELLGPNQFVHATIEAQAATGPSGSDPTAPVARLPGRHAAIRVLAEPHQHFDRWRPLRLRIDPHQVHLFDLATGVRLPAA